MNLAFLALGFRQQARLLAADTRVLTLDSLFSDICVLVTAALALTLMPGLRLQERSLLSMRDRGTGATRILATRVGRRSQRFEQRLAQRADCRRVRGRSGGRSLGRLGSCCVCDLVSSEF